MADYYQPTFDDYFALLKRRWLYLALPFVVVFSLSLAIALLLRPVYRSTGIILVESQRIPDELIRTTITNYIEDWIEIIKQRVMTRENLLKLIDEFGLFEGEQGPETVSERVGMVRKRMEVELLKADQQQRDSKNITFAVSFEDHRPEVAHRVASRLIELFLDENARARTSRASETTEFLKEEANKFKVQLEETESRMASYKQRYSDALPEHLDLKMKMLDRTESDIKGVEREILTVQEEARFLDVQLSAVRMGAASSDDARDGLTGNPAEQLDLLKQEYSKKLATYSPEHPDVRALKRRMDSLSQRLGQPGGASPATSKQSLAVARVAAKIKAAEDRVNSLHQQLQELKQKRQQVEAQIVQTPQVQRELISLERDYESTLKKYKEIQNKQMEAKLAESLEESKKAERFSLLEPALVPEQPVRPKRKKIVAMGFILALASSFGLVMLLESIDKRIRGSLALTALLRQRPLVVIPYISTLEELERRQRWGKWVWLLLAGCGVIGLLLIHLFYQPLDLLLFRIFAGLGG
jgi:polysaccharide chain length determinant protein (PEP-CTERM system associated)